MSFIAHADTTETPASKCANCGSKCPGPITDSITLSPEKMLEMTLGDESVVIQKRAVQNILQLMGKPGRALLEDYVKDEGAATPLFVYITSQLKASK